MLTEERAALKRDLAELKRLFRLAAEVPPPASVPAGGGCMAWLCSRSLMITKSSPAAAVAGGGMPAAP